MLFFSKPLQIFCFFKFKNGIIDILCPASFEYFEDFVLIVGYGDLNFCIFEVDFDEYVAAVVVFMIFVVVVLFALDDFEIFVQGFVFDPCWSRECHDVGDYRLFLKLAFYCKGCE